MSTRTYPANLVRDDSNDALMVTFPDFPEAVTYGEDEADAKRWAVGCLRAMISAYRDDGQPLPAPSKRQPGQIAVTVSVPDDDG